MGDGEVGGLCLLTVQVGGLDSELKIKNEYVPCFLKTADVCSIHTAKMELKKTGDADMSHSACQPPAQSPPDASRVLGSVVAPGVRCDQCPYRMPEK